MSEKNKLAKKIQVTKRKERDWTKERDLRCIPIVHAIFKLIAGLKTLPINNDFLTKDEAERIYFDQIQKPISILFSENDIDVKSELEFIGQCLEEITRITNTLTKASFGRNESILKNAIYDIKDGDLSLYTTTKLLKMVAKKEEIRESIKNIIA